MAGKRGSVSLKYDQGKCGYCGAKVRRSGNIATLRWFKCEAGHRIYRKG